MSLIWMSSYVLCFLASAAYTATTQIPENGQLTSTPKQQQTAVEEHRFQSYLEMLSDAVAGRPKFVIDARNCSQAEWISVTGTRGELYGLRNGDHLNFSTADNGGTNWVCQWKIALPSEYTHLHLSAVIEIAEPCSYVFNIDAFDQEPVDLSVKRLDYTLCSGMDTLVASRTGRLYFKLQGTFSGVKDLPDFTVRFQTTEKSLREFLQVEFTSATSGFISTPGFNKMRKRLSGMRAAYTLSVPLRHVVMVSFSVSVGNLENWCMGGIELFATDQTSAKTSVLRICVVDDVSTEIFNSSLVVEYAPLPTEDIFGGFKMVFSFHNGSEAPERLPNGLFNCSVPHYASFKQHVHCNLQPECHNGEDEGQHCPFSPPGCEESGHGICRENGGELAMMKTRGEWEAFRNYFRVKRSVDSYRVYGLGLRTFTLDMPDIYLRSLKWVDNTVSYYVSFLDLRHLYFDVKSEIYLIFFVYGWPRLFAQSNAAIIPSDIFMCETYSAEGSREKPGRIILSAVNTTEPLQLSPLSLVQCPSGHVTHDFLLCDPASGCVDRRVASCEPPTATEAVPMFMCENGRDTVHYTLLCDFRPDCGDRSDEAFCQHRQHCVGFMCSNGQCVGGDRRCDLVRNCVDGSDEDKCTPQEPQSVLRYNMPPPAVVNFHYGGVVTYTELGPSELCPDTHFQCPGEANYCLPVYVRCNGVYDCADHEDEADCDSYTCPGHYRCRDSYVCVHADHLCDSLPQCPQHDDERFCGQPACPPMCHCQGLAFVCRSPFPAQHFPDLRYLNADKSLMSPDSVSSNHYLIWLSMQFCDISSLPDLLLPNLRSLSLGYNRLQSVSTDQFQGLPNLRYLNLEGNPVTSVKARVQTGIEVFLLSHSQLQVFDSDQWEGLKHVRVLNLSFSRVHAVSEAGFRSLPYLVELDLRGNSLKNYPASLFRDNARLRRLYSDIYKLCCEALLPESFDQNLCFAPDDEVSSCQDLLRSDAYRMLLWVMSVFAILGNAGCIVARVLFPSNSRSGYPVFVSSLSLADLLMGMYLAVIGSADFMYRGAYILHEKDWTKGVVCRLAGFVALLSSEVSAFMICLITLDRFLVLRFPFSSLRFKRCSAVLTCLIFWALCALLAGIPLLPLTTHCQTQLQTPCTSENLLSCDGGSEDACSDETLPWEFFGQTGICIPLPVTRQDFTGRGYAFAVMIVLNFVLFLLIAAGQASIYWSIRANALTVDSTKKTQDLTIAQRLITVAVSDFLCWFPIGLLGIMASLGLPVPGETNVAMAILVMPLNSAINPFLYTYNVLAEKRRKHQESTLTRLLESQLTSAETGELERG